VVVWVVAAVQELVGEGGGEGVTAGAGPPRTVGLGLSWEEGQRQRLSLGSGRDVGVDTLNMN
jgi:hypothetical protein